jgi:hypothetical protein
MDGTSKQTRLARTIASIAVRWQTATAARFLWVAATMTIVVGLAEWTPVPARQSLVVRGRVVRADDPAVPVPRARISLNGVEPAVRFFTDDQGRFEIAAPAASTTLTASKPGFVTATLPLPRRRAPEPLEIPLARGAALTGRVIDQFGQVVVLSGVRVRRVDEALPANPVHVPVNAVTDDRGEFRVGGLAPGRYEVSASFVYDPKEQFESDIAPSALLVVGVPRPTPQPVAITLQAGEEAFVTLNHQEPGATLGAMPESVASGAINGIVVDDFGDPIQGVRVRLWQALLADGRRVLKPTLSSHATDDRGQYRAYRVAPGRYFLSIDDPAGVISEPSLTADTPVFYPSSVTPAEALEIDIGPQQEAAGVNVVFTARRQARVRGVVANATGQPYRAIVTLAAAFHPGEPSMPSRSVTSEAATGAFAFENVAPGDYVVRATNGPSGGRGQSVGTLPGALPQSMTRSTGSEFGAQRIRVSREDPPAITVRTSATSSLVGRITFDGKPVGLEFLSQFAIVAVPDDPDTSPGAMQAAVKVGSPGSSDWTFEIAGMVGPVRLVAKTPAPWWLKSVNTPNVRSPDDLFDPVATTGGQDDLTLWLADTAASVSGRVQNDRSQSESLVVLFPTEERLWFYRSPYIKTSPSGTTSRFTLAGIPPGEYFITAVELDERQRGEWWTDRDALLTLAPTAQRITLSERQSNKVDLQLVPVPR